MKKRDFFFSAARERKENKSENIRERELRFDHGPPLEHGDESLAAASTTSAAAAAAAAAAEAAAEEAAALLGAAAATAVVLLVPRRLCPPPAPPETSRFPPSSPSAISQLAKGLIGGAGWPCG